MKIKKIFFIVSSIIIILLSLYTIIFSKQIVKEQLESLNTLSSVFPQDMINKMTNIYEKGGPIFFCITSFISILASVLILLYSITNKLSFKKNILIFCTIMIFLTGTSMFCTIFAIVDFIILLTIKEQKEEKIKKEIPKLEKIDANLKDKLFAILLLILYFSQLFLGQLLPESFDINKRIMLSIIFDLILLLICILVFNKRLKRDFMALKDNLSAYISYTLPRLGIMYIVFIIISLLVIFISKKAISENQATLEALPLYYTIPLAIIWAPIVEEILFRGCFKRFLKNNIIFIIVSAFIFGILHTISEANITAALIQAIPYSLLGGFFAYIYSKTDNIYCNIFCHFFQNTFAILLSLFFI